MEFIAEFFCEVILEGLFAVTVENPKVKTWVKTTVFLIVSQLLTAIIIAVALDARQYSPTGALIGGIIAAAWGIGMLIAAICGHKKGWPQEN